MAESIIETWSKDITESVNAYEISLLNEKIERESNTIMEAIQEKGMASSQLNIVFGRDNQGNSIPQAIITQEVYNKAQAQVSPAIDQKVVLGFILNDEEFRKQNAAQIIWHADSKIFQSLTAIYRTEKYLQNKAGQNASQERYSNVSRIPLKGQPDRISFRKSFQENIVKKMQSQSMRMTPVLSQTQFSQVTQTLGPSLNAVPAPINFQVIPKNISPGPASEAVNNVAYTSQEKSKSPPIESSFMINVSTISFDGTITIYQLKGKEAQDFMDKVKPYMEEASSDKSEIKVLTGEGAAKATEFLNNPDLKAAKSRAVMPTTLDPLETSKNILKTVGTSDLSPELARKTLDEREKTTVHKEQNNFFRNLIRSKTSNHIPEVPDDQLAREKRVLENIRHNPEESKWKLHVVTIKDGTNQYVLYNSDKITLPEAGSTEKVLKENIQKYDGNTIEIGAAAPNSKPGPINNKEEIQTALTAGISIFEVETSARNKPPKNPHHDIVKAFAEQQSREGRVTVDGQKYSMVSCDKKIYVVPNNGVGMSKQAVNELIQEGSAILIAEKLPSAYRAPAKGYKFDSSSDPKIQSLPTDGFISPKVAANISQNYQKTHVSANDKSANIRS